MKVRHIFTVPQRDQVLWLLIAAALWLAVFAWGCRAPFWQSFDERHAELREAWGPVGTYPEIAVGMSQEDVHAVVARTEGVVRWRTGTDSTGTWWETYQLRAAHPWALPEYFTVFYNAEGRVAVLAL